MPLLLDKLMTKIYRAMYKFVEVVGQDEDGNNIEAKSNLYNSRWVESEDMDEVRAEIELQNSGSPQSTIIGWQEMKLKVDESEQVSNIRTGE